MSFQVFCSSNYQADSSSTRAVARRRTVSCIQRRADAKAPRRCVTREIDIKVKKNNYRPYRGVGLLCPGVECLFRMIKRAPVFPYVLIYHRQPGEKIRYYIDEACITGNLNRLFAYRAALLYWPFRSRRRWPKNTFRTVCDKPYWDGKHRFSHQSLALRIHGSVEKRLDWRNERGKVFIDKPTVFRQSRVREVYLLPVSLSPIFP